MLRTVRPFVALAIAVATLGAATAVEAQVFVYPRRPGQTNVRYDEFDWQHVDLFAGSDASVDRIDPGPRGGADPVQAKWNDASNSAIPRYPLDRPGYGAATGSGSHPSPASGGAPTRSVDELTDRAGGLRLFFYSSERNVAERAAAAIDDNYRSLLEAFDFAPPKTFPFILYSSYQEFLQTNLFPLQEGVLGVTSPRDLKLSLPYFGDHRQFDRVARHELVHQFTIQKVRYGTGDRRTFRDPLGQIPLWFIEGMAEYYTHDGLDDETKMLVRDLAVHGRPRRGYVMGDFFQRGPGNFLWIYKVGQVRCAFLEETYGSGTLQQILEQSYRMGMGRWKDGRVASFEALVERVTGQSPKKIAAKFDQWIKDRAYETYLHASQHNGDFDQLDQIERSIQGLDSAEDGDLLAYKSIDRMTGQNRLFVTDRRDVDSERQVIVDGKPNFESLHPLDGDNFDVRESKIAFVARSQARDTLYVQRLEREVERRETSGNSEGESDEEIRVKLRKGDRTAHPFAPEGLLAINAPSFSPDGSRIAFIGLDEEGQRDIFVSRLETGEDGPSARRITDDTYAERSLDWGEEGIVYTSDRTGHGRYNVFRVTPGSDADPERLTSQPRDHHDVEVLPDGEVVFVAYEDARANLHTVDDEGVSRRTDVPTALVNPSPGPNGGVWTLFHYGGRRIPALVDSDQLDNFGDSGSAPDVERNAIESRSLDESDSYRPFALENWELNNGFGVLGVAQGGIYGQVYATASDRLRNHRLVLDGVAYGSFERSDGSLTYINQANRIVWGMSIFQDLKYRIDETFESVEQPLLSFERFYGLRGLLRYPFNQYAYTQLSLAGGGTSYFLSDLSERYLDSPDRNAPGRRLADEWRERNDSPRPQAEAKLSFGYDNVHYQRQTGPLSGSSLLASVSGDYQPFDDVVYGTARLDGESYLPIYKRVNLFFRTGTGATFGGRFARQFFLSSFYTLRGVPFGNTDFLLGRNFLFSTLEVQFPINFLISIPFVDLEGIAGADFGGVGDTPMEAWERRVFNAVAGVNFGLGPVVLRMHFAKPFDIGAEALPNGGNIVPNLSLGWRYL